MNEHCPKNKIRCTVTGKLYGISKDRLEKLIHKFGSEEAARASYVSLEGRTGRPRKNPSKRNKSATNHNEPIVDIFNVNDPAIQKRLAEEKDILDYIDLSKSILECQHIFS